MTLRRWIGLGTTIASMLGGVALWVYYITHSRGGEINWNDPGPPPGWVPTSSIDVWFWPALVGVAALFAVGIWMMARSKTPPGYQT